MLVRNLQLLLLYCLGFLLLLVSMKFLLVTFSSDKELKHHLLRNSNIQSIHLDFFSCKMLFLKFQWGIDSTEQQTTGTSHWSSTGRNVYYLIKYVSIMKLLKSLKKRLCHQWIRYSVINLLPKKDNTKQ